MATFVRIGEEIINLEQVARVERGDADGKQPAVIVYFRGGDDDKQQHARFTGPRAEGVWEKFCMASEVWDVPADEADAPVLPGRVADQV